MFFPSYNSFSFATIWYFYLVLQKFAIIPNSNQIIDAAWQACLNHHHVHGHPGLPGASTRTSENSSNGLALINTWAGTSIRQSVKYIYSSMAAMNWLAVVSRSSSRLLYVLLHLLCDCSAKHHFLEHLMSLICNSPNLPTAPVDYRLN